MILRLTISIFALEVGLPPVIVLIANTILFGAISTVSFINKGMIYLPSITLTILFLTSIIGIAIYPSILALSARTPEDHFHVAESFDASWRFPFTNQAAAFPHFLIAAEGGIVDAECEVGMYYLFHYDGAAFDRSLACRWLRAAAAKGNIDAQRNLEAVETVPEPPSAKSGD